MHGKSYTRTGSNWREICHPALASMPYADVLAQCETQSLQTRAGWKSIKSGGVPCKVAFTLADLRKMPQERDAMGRLCGSTMIAVRKPTVTDYKKALVALFAYLDGGNNHESIERARKLVN